MKKKHLLKVDYFDTIDTEIKAYMLGFLYADGCNDILNNRIVISLCDIDREILEKFSNELYGMVQLENRKPNKTTSKKGIEYWSKPQLKFCIYSKHICKMLESHGLMSNKSKRIQFPILSPENIVHFIRGYFDGDGSISEHLYEKRIMPKYRIGFVTQSKKFCKQLQQIFYEKTSVKFTIKKMENWYKLNMEGNNQVKIVGGWLYDNSNIHLSRKFEKYQRLLKGLEEKAQRKTSKYMNVSYAKNMNKWLAVYNKNKKRISLGYFNTEDDAFAAIQMAKQK